MKICQYCRNEYKSSRGLGVHLLWCNKNVNRVPIVRVQKERSNKRRKADSIKSKSHNATFWTDEHKKEHSERMKKVVADNPDSYSKNNVSGRVKIYEIVSTVGPTKVKGTWELKVATWLNDNGIKWTNDIQPYSYYWNNSWHLYFPDFLLIDYNVLIEVKGYETERDRLKWKAVTDKKFIVIKEKELKVLDEIILV